MEFFIDRLDSDLVEGWALGAGGIEKIEVLVDGELAGVAAPMFRPDIVAAYPKWPSEMTSRSGFRFVFEDRHFQGSMPSVQIRIVARRERALLTDKVAVAKINCQARSEGERRYADSENLAPLPGAVMAALYALRGPDCYGHRRHDQPRFDQPRFDQPWFDQPWTDELSQEAISDIEFLLRRGGGRQPGIHSYLAYLKRLWTDFLFIRDYFPKVANPDVAAKDAWALQNSPEEMITLAHHLFVLRHNGMMGNLAEFGCFKGYSTAMLSRACFDLGIEMDVFDSFAGLPPSESAYYNTGDFCGSLEEVKRNVTEFGQIRCVHFHRGFFSETLPGSNVSPMCIWMDVDLATSSRDVMTILERVPVRSCVFSHECRKEDFAGGAIVPRQPDPNYVISPIVQAFERTGRAITGRYLAGNTGAFWARNVAWPVLPADLVLKLCRMA